MANMTIPLTASEIHISDVNTFKACRRQWNWSSRLRSNLQPKRPYHAFFFGRAIHECLDKYYGLGQSWETTLPEFVEKETELIRASAGLWDQDREMIEEQTAMAEGMMQHYLQWEPRQKGPFAMSNLEWLTVEQKFRVPLIHPITLRKHPRAFFAGKIDGLVRRNDNGDVYIIEWKTAKSIPQRARTLPNDEQATAYLNAMRHVFGTEVKGLIYTIMSKRVPPFPKVLNSGFLTKDTKDQSIDSYIAAIRKHHAGKIAELYREAADDADFKRVENEFIAANYGPTIMQLHGSTDSKNIFFERHVVTRTDRALQKGGIDLWDAATEMTRRTLPIYATSNFHCSYCMFYDPCMLEQNSGNAELLLNENFVSRPDDDEVTEE